MDVKIAIEKRRSIRKYKDKGVSQEVIDELIEAARLAPSACHGQPWRFMVITDKKVINKLKENKVFYQDFIYTAPLLLVCMTDPRCYSGKLIVKENFEKIRNSKFSKKNFDAISSGNVNNSKFSKEKNNNLKDLLIYAVSDLSFASQNLVLRAVELGLGSCYIGWMKTKKIKQVLDIPDNLHVQFVIALGYPDEEPGEKVRKSKEEILL